MSNELEKLILIKDLEIAMLIFVCSVVQQVSSWIITSPSLVDDKPNAVIIYLGTSDILCNARHEDIARNIIRIGSNCKSRGVNDVFISSILVLKRLTLNPFIRRVNDMLRVSALLMVWVLFVTV